LAGEGVSEARVNWAGSMMRFLLTRVEIDRQTSTSTSDLTPRKVGESHPRRPRSNSCSMSSLTFQPQQKAFGADDAERDAFSFFYNHAMKSFSGE
jgi:hypothetical protein